MTITIALIRESIRIRLPVFGAPIKASKLWFMISVQIKLNNFISSALWFCAANILIKVPERTSSSTFSAVKSQIAYLTQQRRFSGKLKIITRPEVGQTFANALPGGEWLGRNSRGDNDRLLVSSTCEKSDQLIVFIDFPKIARRSEAEIFFDVYSFLPLITVISIFNRIRINIKPVKSETESVELSAVFFPRYFASESFAGSGVFDFHKLSSGKRGEIFSLLSTCNSVFTDRYAARGELL